MNAVRIRRLRGHRGGIRPTVWDPRLSVVVKGRLGLLIPARAALAIFFPGPCSMDCAKSGGSRSRLPPAEHSGSNVPYADRCLPAVRASVAGLEEREAASSGRLMSLSTIADISLSLQAPAGGPFPGSKRCSHRGSLRHSLATTRKGVAAGLTLYSLKGQERSAGDW
jgi:hypothetical protein